MIETYEQYEFLYLCLVDFVETNGIYTSQSTESFQTSRLAQINRDIVDDKYISGTAGTKTPNKTSASRLRDHTLNSIHLNID